MYKELIMLYIRNLSILAEKETQESLYIHENIGYEQLHEILYKDKDPENAGCKKF